eukprot:6827355-Lingulodinium_polyedra.AAC.1
MKCHSLHEECMIKGMSMVKECAAHAGLLPKVLCEDQLCGTTTPMLKSVTEDLVAKAKEARESCNSMAGSSCKSGEDIKALLIAKENNLKLMD